MEAKYETIYRECEAYFERNYPNADTSDKNLYIKGVIDVIQRLQNKNI
jgi:hypothetical protein